MAVLVVIAVGGCGGVGTDGTPSPSGTTTEPSAPSGPTLTAGPTTGPKHPRPQPAAEAAATAPRGLLYYAGRRARTDELLLFAEQSGFTGRQEMLPAVRAVMTRPPVDQDYTSLWSGDVVDSVRLFWDGTNGFYRVWLLDDRATRRPPGMSMRGAHLAIQQVVWTLHSVGGIRAPVLFSAGRSSEPVTSLLGVPSTGPDDTYLPAHYTGVLSSMNILAPADGATVDGLVEISGVAESFEATVGVRVVDEGGEVVVEDGTTADECCGRLFPWSHTLDVSAWPPGEYTLSALTDDPVGLAQGSDGPEVDTKTFTVE